MFGLQASVPTSRRVSVGFDWAVRRGFSSGGDTQRLRDDTRGNMHGLSSGRACIPAFYAVACIAQPATLQVTGYGGLGRTLGGDFLELFTTVWSRHVRGADRVCARSALP